MPYQNYHRHSHYSNIILADSVATNEDYCKRAKEQGHSIISSCEHGTQGNYRECATLAEKYGLKWRYVTEAYFVKDRLAENADGRKDTANCHMILAAKTAKGVGDLNNVLSEANLTGYYTRPRIDLELLMTLDPDDVFITTACVGGIFKYGFEEAERLIQIINGRFRDSFMLEVQYHHTEKQKTINEFLLKMYRKYGIPIIMGTDSHYIYPADSVLRDQRLEANHIKYEDEDGWFMDYPSDEEAYQRFIDQGVLSPAQIREAMSNTNIFLEFEDIVLDKSKKLPTIYPSLSQEERNQKYRELINEKWEQYKKDVDPAMWPVYEAGIKYEVDTITSTNTSDYFLLDYSLVKRGKELGGKLTYTGRGSAPSFFTNTLLGFSSIDRFALPITMYPDRFISKDRLLAGNLPDIDMNCGDVETFAQAQSEVLGEWRSAPMVAFGTLKRLSAWKMYCRANDVDYDIANKISDSLKDYERDLKYAKDESDDEEEEEDVDVRDYVPAEYHEILAMSEKYMGMIDSISPHPCAYLLCCEDIRREIGIFRINSKTGKKKIVYTAFIDGATAEAYGYLKNDLLKVDVVKVNAEAYHRIGIPQPTVSELLKLSEDDSATWDMYAKGYTMGLNQAEKEKSTEKVMRYKPKNISELSAFVAGIRPAFQSMINMLLDRRHFDYSIPALDKLLQTEEMPNSFILYQEQMMTVLQYASFSAPESYSSIKAIAKKHPEKVLPLKARFLEGFSKRLNEQESVPLDIAKETADRVWVIISDACGYGFNSSHSAAVALDSLYGAYAKAHYPYEYYTTLLANYAAKGDKDRIAKVKVEMKKAFGIQIVPCRFRQDNRDYYIDKNKGQIADALTSVKHISKRVADALYGMRNKEYASFTDVLVDMEISPAFNTTSITILIKMGYFEEFGSVGKLLSLFSEFKDGKNKYSKSHVEKTKEKRLSILREIEKALPEIDLPISEIMAFEVEHYGTPMSIYPEHKGKFAVLEVDDKYSPKIRMYNIAAGTVGLMKVRKPLYKKNPLEPGMVISLDDWVKKPAYQYVDGVQRVKPGIFDFWIQAYKISA